jgi:hypothetical protein
MDFINRYKKILGAALFIFTAFFFGFLLYILFFKSSEPPAIEPGPATTTPGILPSSGTSTKPNVQPGNTGLLPNGQSGSGQLPDNVARGGLTKTPTVTDLPIQSATLSADGKNPQFYNKNDGKFYRIDENGNLVELSSQVFHSVDNIVWSPDSNKAIIEYPDGANIIYDFDSDSQVTLPKHWQEFNFSKDGQQIVMKSYGLDPNNRWLAITNTDGSKSQAIEELGENGDQVLPLWSPSNQVVALYTEGSSFDSQKVYFVGKNKENFKAMTIEGRGFQAVWSLSGNRLLYSVYSSDNGMKPLLWIANAQGDEIGSGRKSLNVETWADKCLFAEENKVYCAVPESLEQGAGMFPELARNTKDNLYEIDTSTGLKKLIAIPDGSFNISQMFLNNEKGTLYFTDSNTSKLHEVSLK